MRAAVSALSTTLAKAADRRKEGTVTDAPSSADAPWAVGQLSTKIKEYIGAEVTATVLEVKVREGDTTEGGEAGGG